MSPLRVLGAVAGLLSLPAALWAFLHFFQVLTVGWVAVRAPHYQPAVFELEWTYLEEGSSVAVGTIDGRRELMSVAALLPRRATGYNDLEDLMAGKERLEVLYDPGGTRTSFAGARLRVLLRVEELRRERLARLWKIANRGYGPLALLLTLSLGIAWLDEKASPGWAVPGLFFGGFQVVGLAFVLFIEALEGGPDGQGWPVPLRGAVLAAATSALVLLVALSWQRRRRRADDE